MAEPPLLSLLEAVRTYLRVDSDSDSDRTPSPGSKALAENSSTRVPEPSPQIPGFFFEEKTELPTMTPEQAAFSDAFISNMRDEALSKESQPKLVSVAVPAGPKKKLLDGMKEALADPNLRVTTRHRFIELTNSAIYLNNILFRRASEFLCPEDVVESQAIVGGMMRYLGLVDDMLVDLLEVASHVDYMLGLLLAEEETPETRYRRMVCVIQAHLKKPRGLEQKLLELYREFFGEWVHAKFLCERNAQILTEESADMGRIRLTRYMRAAWDVLTRCIDNYVLYRAALVEIKEQRFAQNLAHVQVSSVPAIGEWFGELP